MQTFLIYSFLTLTALGRAEAQAETLLEYARETKPELYSSRHELTIDGNGYLWLLAEWGGDGCVSRIRPNGREDLDRLLLMDGEGDSWVSLGNMMTCDRWGNLYCGLGVDKHPGTLYVPGSLHPFRVTPEGDTRDYYPWPDMKTFGVYMEILSGDTLVLMNDRHSGGGMTLAKAIIDSTGLTPIIEKTYLHFHPLMVTRPDPFFKDFFDWNRGYGLYVEMDEDMMRTIRFDLKSSENSFPSEELEPYNWRDYVWRTFDDAWIGWITFVPYIGGGYLMCISDPDDRSITHLVRLDYMGEPIEPSTLDDGGSKRVRKFDKLPSSARPYVEFEIWDKPGGLARDSAQVLFWGCDDEGNLYTHRGVRKY